jgi:DNA-binding GntR family transcriptional regulator
MIENIDTPTLSARAYSMIKQDIVNCTLEPGQFIAQVNLANNYQVGLTPVREALRQLSTDGYVQAIPRMGYVVSNITLKDVEEIFEMRLILETTAVRMAATKGSETDLNDLRENAVFTYTFKDKDSYSVFLRDNRAFHLKIAVLSKNNRLAAQVAKIMDELTRVFHIGLDIRDSAEEMRNDHIELAEALSNKDGSLAERLIRAEILLSRERVMEALKNYSGNSTGAGNTFTLNKVFDH